MTSRLEIVTALKAENAHLQAEADQAEGALRLVLKSLKDEFGCGSVVQAKQRLKRLSANLTKERRTYEQSKTAFEKKWKTKL
jgi:hypothetical protein